MPEKDPSSTLNALTLLGQDTRVIRQFMDYFIEEFGGVREFAKLVAQALKSSTTPQAQKLQIIRQLLVAFSQVDRSVEPEDFSDIDPVDLELAYKQLQQKAAG